MVQAHGCGLFDGGCLAVASALQQRLGGEVMVMVDEHDFAQHAVLAMDGWAGDASGLKTQAQALGTFSLNELAPIGRDPVVRLRALQPGDLPEAPHDPELVAALAQCIPDSLDVAATGCPYPSRQRRKGP